MECFYFRLILPLLNVIALQGMADICLTEKNRKELNESQRSILYFKCIPYSHWHESTKLLGPHSFICNSPGSSTDKAKSLLAKLQSNSTSFVSYWLCSGKRFLGLWPPSACVCLCVPALVLEWRSKVMRRWGGEAESCSTFQSIHHII